MISRMHVAILSTAPVNTNGWGRYTRDLIGGLANQDAQITLITSINASPTTDLPVAAYHRVLPSVVPPMRMTALRLLAALPTVCRLSAGCDVVHVIAEPYTLAVPPNCQLVVTAHGTYLPRTAKRRLIGALYRRAYRRAMIICVSSFTEKQALAAVPGLRTTVITNGVDAARFRQPGTAPEKCGPTVLSVGQLKPRKGFHILVQATRLVREAIPDAQAVLIGDTSDNNSYRVVVDQIERDRLQEAVHVLGRVADDVLLGWYHAADVFALPAINIGKDFEGFGLVYLEGNAAGLPAVGTLGCGAEDAIRDGETGFLVPQNDVPATANALIQLLKDPVLRAKMGAAGIAHAEAHNWDSIARRVLDVYHAASQVEL